MHLRTFLRFANEMGAKEVYIFSVFYSILQRKKLSVAQGYWVNLMLVSHEATKFSIGRPFVSESYIQKRLKPLKVGQEIR